MTQIDHILNGHAMTYLTAIRDNYHVLEHAYNTLTASLLANYQSALPTK